MKNRLMVVVEDSLYSLLYNMDLSEKEIENNFLKLKENENVFYDDKAERFIFLEQNQYKIMEDVKLDFFRKIEDLYSNIIYWYEGDEFGIEKSNGFLSWNWDEVYEGIECQINDVERIEKTFDRIKKVGLDLFLEEIINNHVAEMIRIKIEEVLEKVNTLEIDHF